MATAPAFAATPVIGAGTPSATASTSLTAPSNPTTLLTGGTSGTKIEEIQWIPNGSPPVLGVLTIFLYDGTTYRLIDACQVNATPTNSTTVAPGTPTTTVGPERRRYTNLWLPDNTWSLRFASTVANQLVTVVAFGLNF